MLSNLDRYKKDLETLIDKGGGLHNAMMAECFPEGFEKEVKKLTGNDKELAKQFRKNVPSFKDTYQLWYSEAKVLVKQLLPERLADFVSHYEKPKGRKAITWENYKIEDYLQDLRVTRSQGYLEGQKIVGPDAAIPQFVQQWAIVKSVQRRFESSIFDIRQLVQADLFDSELDAAQELCKNKFTRAAGALAGVVLERHLAQVCDSHGVQIAKKEPTIAELNDALKGANIIDIPQWRFVQHLGDIRNLCDHKKTAEPTLEQVNDLIAGVAKVTKTMF
jgi:hypothetical protein